ncbi:MAG TPA: hypothetical protein VFL07_17325, partial [Rudaea sp.]|nr:hypothetical protein [Rudaea sp.]
MRQRIDAVDDAVARLDPGGCQRTLIVAARGAFDGSSERPLRGAKVGVESWTCVASKTGGDCRDARIDARTEFG